MSVAISLALVVVVAFLAHTLTQERRRHRDALREAASGSRAPAQAEREALRLARILAAMPDGVMVVEGDQVAYANPAIARLLGGDPGRILPATRNAGDSSFLVTVHHPAYREVRCTRTVLDQVSMLVVVRDVTESRRLDRMRADFVANASHELKTPVAAILATTETLSTAIEEDAEAAVRFVRTLGSEAHRLSELVKDLLDLARLDQGNGASEDTCSAAAVAAGVVKLPPRNAKLEIGLTVTTDTEVRVRAEDLALAIRNLLDNAIRHTPATGRIDVDVRRAGESVLIEVKDTGDGIPAKDLPRIFERFYRVDPARGRETGGTGLGLAIVKHVVESVGGSVAVTSDYGAGSTFTISLPRNQS